MSVCLVNVTSSLGNYQRVIWHIFDNSRTCSYCHIIPNMDITNDIGITCYMYIITYSWSTTTTIRYCNILIYPKVFSY